jgi:type VI secretion system FHA domain protein
LQDGDLLFVDTYQIKVTIHGEQTVLHSREVAAQQSAPYYPEDHTASLALAPEDEETEWFGLSEEKPAPRVEPPVQPRIDAMPAAGPASKAAPQHSRKVGEARRSESPRDRNVPGANVLGDDAKLQVLLSAAGLNGISVSNELAQTLGKMLRVAVGGLMDVLRSRERMKDEMRMRGTTFKPAHNNPLKFSANVDDAFHNLLVKHNPAYLAPPDALEDAFRDVRDHQTATLAAMRLAFEAMLAQFDPEQLQEDFDRQLKKGAMLGVPAKLRYWDLYRDKYGHTVKDAEAAFRTLFSEQFASAYEEQLNRLKARAHSYDKDGGSA